jgi:hypothetical protein
MDTSASQIHLDKSLVQNALKSMDTEWDRFSAKFLLLGNKSQNEIENLGIKPEKMLTHIERFKLIIEELQNTQIAAADMVQLQLKDKIKSIEDEINALEHKSQKVKEIWDESALDALQNDIDEKKQRCANVTEKLERTTPAAKVKFQRATRHKATELAEANRLKRRKYGAGAKRKLDSDDENFIAKCIEEKGEAHGRRTDSVIYGAKRVKYDDLLNLTNYNLAKKGKPLIKSKSTVQLLSKPRNSRSRQAKFHHGRGLFCTRKPPKNDKDENENTHHQRAQVRLLKQDMFLDKMIASHSLIISSDDKAYLRPGTDVGAKGARKQSILTPTDPDKAKALPQHDFSEPKVHITPSSFRFMTKMPIEVEDGKTDLIRDEDQSIVIVRPKYYVGSSGSVWASDYMRIRHEYPHLFEVKSENVQWCLPVRRLCNALSDYVLYFLDTSEESDIKRVQKKKDCPHKIYESLRLQSLASGLKRALDRYSTSLHDVSETQQTDLGSCLECAEVCVQQICLIQTNMLQSTGQVLLNTYHDALFKGCQSLLTKIQALDLPACKTIIAELTDAGPGVGISNFEVQFREAEKSRINDTIRRTRLHRSRGDSAQNESERTNACIGEALVDGSALKWNYFDALDGKCPEEIEKMTMQDITAEEDKCMERNAWKVADDVRCRIHMEPGPAGDLMLALVTDVPNDQFYYNAKYLQNYHKAGKSKRKDMPGSHYFQKIERFIDIHFEKGEIYLEYLNGVCQQKTGQICDHCLTETGVAIGRSTKPFPDYSKLPKFHYLPLESTPMEIEGNSREVDDYQPRANLKKLYRSNEISPSNQTAVSDFSKKYIVDEEFVVAYVKHLAMLDLKKMKRKSAKKGATVQAVINEEVESEESDECSANSDSGNDIVLATIDETDDESDVIEVQDRAPQITRSGRRHTTAKTRHFFGDSD